MNNPRSEPSHLDAIRSALGSLSRLQLPDLADEIGAPTYASDTKPAENPRSAVELEALMDAVPAIVWVAHDRDCAHMTGNQAAAAFLRLPKHANAAPIVIQEAPPHYRLFKGGRELAPHEFPMFVAARGTPVRDWEIELAFGDGTRRILFGNAEPLLDREGASYGAVGAFVDVTPRRAAEEALRRSELEFRAMFELAGVGNVQTVDGRFTRVNRKFCDMLGYDESELLGLSVLDITHPDDRAASEDLLKRKEAGEISEYQTEKRYLRKDGSTLWVQLNVRVLSIAPARSLATVQDISERRRIENERKAALQRAESLANKLKQQLTEAEARRRILDTLLEQIPTGITIADANDPSVRVVSRYGRELIGLPADSGTRTPTELHASYWRLLTEHGELIPIGDRPLRRAFERGQIIRDQEYVLERADGSRVTVLCNATPIRDRDGYIAGGVVTWHDITERNRTEAALRESQETLMRAQAVANIGSFDYDLVANRVRWSPQLYTIFGVDPRTFVPDPVNGMELIAEEDRDRVRRSIQTAIAERRPYRVEHRIRRPDGSERIVLTQGEVTHWDDNGRPLCLVGTTLDLTDRRRTEEELRKRHQLESLGLLAGGIAHDFNNILTVIFGNIALAQLKSPPDSPAMQALKEAESGFKRAIDLTKQLLTFSKGGAPIRKSASLADLVADSVGFILRGSNVSLDLRIARDLWPVQIDEGQISQAINNLVINAKEAMPHGGRLEVEARNLRLDLGNGFGLKPNRYVLLRIKDWGRGISENEKERIFDPYFTTKPGGTGLGLTTTYSIIQRHEGHITFDSRVGKGTSFYIYLPASDKPSVQTETNRSMVAHGHGRILLMDDDRHVREVGERLLRQLDYQVDLAQDGEQALRMVSEANARGDSYAALILDLTVPGGMGGKECLLRLRRVDRATPVLVSTGYSNDPVVANYHAYGFQGVVPKPYRIEDLSQALSAVRS